LRSAGKGSHLAQTNRFRCVFRLDGRKVIVASHSGEAARSLATDIPTGALRQICKQAGWEWPLAR